jgi:hypothetical protein
MPNSHACKLEMRCPLLGIVVELTFLLVVELTLLEMELT